VGNDDGTMTVLRAGRRKERLAEIDMMAPLYSRPAPTGDGPAANVGATTTEARGTLNIWPNVNTVHGGRRQNYHPFT
jgi:hypothetical protein